MEDNYQQTVDHYDFINAPQFVDFDDLASHDDPQADKFFETHREEDDFTIPDINSISPTVQLLYDDDMENKHYSNEANKAAMAAGLEDVKIEYYASPQQQSAQTSSQPSSANKKSITSMYGTPLGASGLSSNGTSFYTPTGGEDKENVTPTTTTGSAIRKNGSANKKTAGKLDVVEIVESNEQRGILSERVPVADDDTLIPTPNKPITQSLSTLKTQNAVESLYSKFDNLVIGSDEEEEEVNIECAPQLSQEAHHQNQEQSPPSTPIGESEMEDYSTFSTSKLTFFGLSDENKGDNGDPTSGDTDSCSESEVTLIGRGSAEPAESCTSYEDIPISPISNTVSDSEEEEEGNKSMTMELRTPIRNILKKLDAELNFEVDRTAGDNVDDPRYSIVVAPCVGQQVYWNVDGEAGASMTYNKNMTGTSAVTCDRHDSEDDSETEVSGYFLASASRKSSSHSKRRSSSVGNTSAQVSDENPIFQHQAPAYESNYCEYSSYTGETLSTEYSAANRVTGAANGASTLPALNIETFNLGKNSCYFEIEPPQPSKDMRRVSSCSDLLNIQRKAVKTIRSKKVVQKKPLTIPRTPEAAKRSQKSTTSRNNTSGESESSVGLNQRGPVKAGTSSTFTVDERLQAAKNRKPMKANHYVSMAEAMIKYQKNTPDRFRSLPKGHTVPEKRSTSANSRSRYSPSPARSPEPKARSRGNSFTAKDRAPRSATKGSGPVLPKKTELKTTIPKPFNFGSTHRQKPAALKEDPVDFKFKARPAPTKAPLDSTVVLKPKQAVKVTQPRAPHFASDDRLRERHQKRALDAAAEPTKPTKTKPILAKTSRIPTTAATVNASMSRAHVDEHKTTVAQPFSSSFDARQKEIIRKKEEKIKQEQEEQAKKLPGFHANPVPNFSVKLPKKKLAGPTQVEPFRFKSDERGAAYQEAFKRSVEQEEQKLKEQALFHAQPADVIHKAPFEPEKPGRVTEVDDFQLATERRAAEREEFDIQIQEKIKDEEERKREEEERLEEIQRQEEIERRRQMVHKAQPFKHPKQFELQSSARTLTVPQSPAFNPLPSQRRIIKPSDPEGQQTMM